MSSERVRLWLERVRGGYRVRDASTEKLVRDADPRGVRAVSVAGVSYRMDALQDEAFTPGRRLALLAEPDNEHDSHAIAVWDAEQRVQVGYLPAEIARDVRAEEWQAVSLHEYFEGDQRCGLRVLLAPRDAWIGTPRS